MNEVLKPIKEVIEKLELKTELKEYYNHSTISKGKYIYFAFFNNQIIYIGKSENIKKRLNAHYSGKRSGSQFCVYFFDKYICNQELLNNIENIEKNLTSEIDKKIKHKIEAVKFQYLEIGKTENSLSKIESYFIREMQNIFPNILNMKIK